MSLGGLSYPNESHLKKKKKKKKKKTKPNGRISRILYDPTILCNPTQSYIRPYHFCDSTTILNSLVRWDCKIVQFYNPNHDFDNHT